MTKQNRQNSIETNEELQSEELRSQELDLGLETEEEQLIELDYDAAMAKLKPDYLALIKPLLEVLKSKPENQEKLEEILLVSQSTGEGYLKDTIVPKIASAVEAKFNKGQKGTSSISSVKVSEPEINKAKIRGYSF